MQNNFYHIGCDMEEKELQEKEHLGVRISVELKRALEEVARENRRSLSAQVELFLEQCINR